MATQILQGALILPDRLLERGQVVVEGGVIQAVSEVEAGAGYTPTHDLGDVYVAPGFVDLHTHGIAGADIMDATHESLATMSRRYAAHGVTGFLPTTMTQSPEATRRAVEQAARFIAGRRHEELGGARALGIHLEGPWISREYKGAQNGHYIVPPDEDALRDLLGAAGGAIKIVTLAPELPGAWGMIRLLREQGIAASIGHTGASYEDALRAVEAGATHVTHCFNAMTGLHHRHPGVVGAALLHDELYAELIADGVHVDPAVMRLLIRVKGRERVMLITDSMAAAELSDGTYDLGGQPVLVRNGEARLHDGTLAGSTLTMDRAVRNLVRRCDVSLPDAVYMATAVPAAAIGLGERKGRIAAGFDADLAILDAELRPVRVMVGGHLLHAQPPAAVQ